MFFQNITDPFSWLISLSIGLVTFYLVRFYTKVYTLPPGPFPLPLIGNILIFYKTKVNQFITINDLHKKYGPVFTLWFGATPMVVIGDFELSKKAFNSKNNELMGRPDFAIRKFLTQDNGYDVVFTDHGPIWASLRKVAHSAVRYSWNDEELKFYENSFEFFRKHTESLAIPDRVPILKPLYYKTYRKVGQTLVNISMNVRKKYITHLEDHQKGIIRDFCDALIEAKEEAINEEKETAPFLSDINLSLVIMNLFFAGSDTTQYMMRWIILLMANNLEMQTKMRKEIDNNIGDRLATHEDRNHCHYVNAFIAETLRFRSVAPLGVPHRAMVDYKLYNYTILKDSLVFSNLLAVSEDTRIWSNPQQFNPNRFLTSEGTFNSQINGFTPFGIGRRVCLGEKLALIDLFLITVRFLKSTNHLSIELTGGEGSADLEPNPNILFLNVPKDYEILLRKL